MKISHEFQSLSQETKCISALWWAALGSAPASEGRPASPRLGPALGALVEVLTRDLPSEGAFDVGRHMLVPKRQLRPAVSGPGEPQTQPEGTLGNRNKAFTLAVFPKQRSSRLLK